MSDNERANVMEKIGYLIAKMEDTNEIVKKIDIKLDSKADKDTVEKISAETCKNSDFRKKMKTQIAVISSIVAGGISVIGFILTVLFGIFF